MAKLRRKIVRTVSELVMGEKRYARPGWRKKETEKAMASRRRLNRIREQVRKTDRKIGSRLKKIDKLHTKLKRRKSK